MPEQSPAIGAVFLSYASQDAPAAQRICEALRAAGVEVWLDKNELRGGDAWDAQIKKRIHDCALFVPLISAHTNARIEGYFRREWKLATRRLLDRSDDAAFLVPVVVDGTREADARVPEEFLRAQWTWLPGGETPPAFAQRVRQLLGADGAGAYPTHAAVNTGIEGGARVPYIRNRNALTVRPVAIALAAMLAVGAGVFWYYQQARDVPAAQPAPATALSTEVVAPQQKSIAVLPFADMSAEKNQEYMSDGIAEELLNLLAQVPDLKVIARTSSFAFKGQNIEVSEIAKRLNVAHVLEGSVRTSGNQVRITAQLVRAADSTHVWSERYDRPMDDIFAVQDEIANAIVQALQIRLKGGTLSRRAGGTQNLAAYELYLRAVSASQRNKASLDAAEDYANQAVKLDPQFGLAWYQLAIVVSEKMAAGYLPTKMGYEKFEQLIQHALRLSPDLAEAHAGLHNLYLQRDFDWAAAKAELQRALAIDPTNPKVLGSAAISSTVVGDFGDAERQFREAMQRDPLDANLQLGLSTVYYYTGRLVEAERMIRAVLEQHPDREWTRASLARILLLQGKVGAALTEVKKERSEGARIATLPLILHAAGRNTEAEEALKKQIDYWADEYAESIARSYAYMGDHDRAMAWLERAYQQKDTDLFAIVGDPMYGSIADDPRYKAFLRTRLKLPERS